MLWRLEALEHALSPAGGPARILDGVHPAYFSALFKRVTGLPPRAYLTQYRLDRVRELLLSTDLPIARIAQQAGFSDQSYLSRVFREGEGSSPTEYRARNTLSKS